MCSLPTLDVHLSVGSSAVLMCSLLKRVPSYLYYCWNITFSKWQQSASSLIHALPLHSPQPPAQSGSRWGQQFAGSCAGSRRCGPPSVAWTGHTAPSSSSDPASRSLRFLWPCGPTRPGWCQLQVSTNNGTMQPDFIHNQRGFNLAVLYTQVVWLTGKSTDKRYLRFELTYFALSISR